MKNKLRLLGIVPILLLSACKADYPGAMETPEPEASAVQIESLSLTDKAISNGLYDLEAYVRGPKDSVLIITSGSHQSTTLLNGEVWTFARLRGIEVTDGKLSLNANVMNGGDYTFKTGYLKKTSSRRSLVKGGDFSMLSQVEKNGGKYYDRGSGSDEDVFTLSARNGMNMARLRLYNNPGMEVETTGMKMFTGIQDEADILALAKRAKDAGMDIELTFHYSDYWTNGGEQFKPTAWVDASQSALRDSVYQYTKRFLRKMVSQGTTPRYVSIGNEIQSGILFGRFDEKNHNCTDSLKANGYVTHIPELAALLNAGSRAVRETCPDAKIVLHLTTSTDINLDTYKWFFNNMRNYMVDYDIIGASYYPYFGNYTIETMIEWANQLTSIYNKDWLFMEVGYAWNSTLRDGTIGQLATNQPYEEMTPSAQRKFMIQLTEAIENASSRILGYIYWDPIYLDAPNCGYREGEKNVVNNYTLFDFNGHALPAWDAIKYNK